MQIDIVAMGDYYRAVDQTRPVTDLRQELEAHCRERFRRIDRYIQLALLGSGRCIQHLQPVAGTGLYVGSRFASINNATQLQQRLLAHNEIPKPANFINTLSNTAGYYVARNLGLSGRNLFVSRQDASVFAALRLAQLDLTSSSVEMALVGIVEETGLPTEQHCRRMGIPDYTALGEGSHWFLLRKSADESALASISNLSTLPGPGDFYTWLEAQRTASPNYQWFATPRARSWIAANVPHLLAAGAEFDPRLHYYPGMLAGALIRHIQSGDSRPLLAIDADGQGRFHVLRLHNRTAPLE